MNSNDSGVLKSILDNHLMDESESISDSDIIFINTCAIRDKAEEKVHQKIKRLM